MIQPGSAAPDFTLPDQDGNRISLSGFRGRTVVLAFYPADFSPVCTDQLSVYQEVLPQLGPAAREKQYLGYSDAGYMLAGLYAAGFPRVAHGPMPKDVAREGGEEAVLRALSWLVAADSSVLEPNAAAGEKAVAFNITVFSQLLGTVLQPDLTDHVLMIEDVSEYMYRTDRSMFHITSNPGVRKAAGIRLGRCTEVPENDVDFGETEEEVVRHWCQRSGIAYLGRADIGHDADNKVVPFGIAHNFLR